MKHIVKRPVITEKSLGLASQGWYTFAVDIDADKRTVARAVEGLYKVNVTGVKTIAMHGKTRRVGKRQAAARKSDWKKAIVHLKTGQKIDAFEVTVPEQEKA